MPAVAQITHYGYSVYTMTWEWDDEKDEENRIQHGLSFAEALRVFTDPYGIEKEDVAHSTPTEQRRWRVGKLPDGRIVTVVYTMRGENKRLISAQERRRERREYEKAHDEKKR
jgi:uncharacterized protein